jgi:hypothetical protein
MLTVAEQPLRLSELSNALGIRKGAEDHSDKRVPKLPLIEDLCGQLVIFDRVSKGSQTDPLLKLAHKSIQDFFTQDPKSLNIPDDLCQFFINLQSANLEIGQTCLTYLGYARYQKPIDILAILENGAKEHAFLKYAATFWFWHLMRAGHSSQLFAAVERFIQSPAFWTCLTVQSKIAPHLLARLTESKQGSFRLSTTGPRGCDIDHKISFAFPLPDWLDEYGPSGQAIVQDFHAFIKEWHPVLTSYPQVISQCIRDVTGRRTFPCRNPSEFRGVEVFSSFLPATSMSDVVNLCLESVRFDEKGLHARILEDREAGLKRDIELRRIHISSGKSSEHGIIRRSITSPHSSRAFHMFSGEDTEDSPLWLLDLKDLSLTQHHNLSQKTFNAPAHMEKVGATPEPDALTRSWVINKKFAGRTAHGEAFTYHCSKTYTGRREGDDSGYGSSHSDLDSESNSESDSDSALDEPDVGPVGYTRHCLVMVHQECSPSWFPWQSDFRNQLQISCAFHPTESIALWSHAAYEVCMADLRIGHITTRILPEPVDVQLRSAAAVCKGKPCPNVRYSRF